MLRKILNMQNLTPKMTQSVQSNILASKLILSSIIGEFLTTSSTQKQTSQWRDNDHINMDVEKTCYDDIGWFLKT